MQYEIIETPIGPLTAVMASGFLLRLDFGAHDGRGMRDVGALHQVRKQLEEYFDRRRTSFDLNISPEGTPFQIAVWGELTRIPYGETRSYGQIAAAIGRPLSARAVGAANGANPIAIVIPCHRVIGANGSLVGYGGGLDIKSRLLDFEQSALKLDF